MLNWREKERKSQVAREEEKLALRAGILITKCYVGKIETASSTYVSEHAYTDAVTREKNLFGFSG